MEFTLPALTQESFSRWFNKKVPRNDNVEERIVYPGVKLHCSTKSRDLRSQIMPENVFVTQEVHTNVFHHKVLGSNNAFVSLPKRLYSHCFRNINIHSIPTGNRITVRLTETTSVVLPFIPDDFVNQKRSKRNASSRSRPKRDKRLKCAPKEEPTHPYTGWVTKVMSPATDTAADNAIDAFHLMSYIRTELAKSQDELNTCIPNPFAGAGTLAEIQDSPDKSLALTTVLQFVHHYAKHIL
tara:strand:- start:2752 stop:3471 length:720 start_codon:yes stop_codon:yes gene_type:complete